MSKYKVLKPIQHGDRIEAGEVVEMSDDIAKAFGPAYVELYEEVEEVEVVEEEEKSLEEMSKKELQAKAEELGLATDGSKADLIERLTINEQ